MARVIQEQEMGRIKSIIFRYYRQILVVFFCLLFALEYFVVIHPYQEMTKNGEALDIDYYHQLLEDEEQFLTNMEALIREMDSLDEQALSKLDDLMASEINIPELINMFHLIAEENDYQLKNISFSPEQGTILINVDFSGGDYRSFKQLLKTIENNIRITDITDLSFQGAGESCSFTLLTYYLE